MLDSGRVAFQAHDFFEPQPPWSDAFKKCKSQGEASESRDDGNRSNEVAVFLLRVITHDWPDEFVLRYVMFLDSSRGLIYRPFITIIQDPKASQGSRITPHETPHW